MWVILVFFSVKISLIYGNIHEKCCEPNQIITEVNSSLLCVNSPNTRMESFFAKNAFMLKNTKGTCIELYEKKKTGIFSIDALSKKISLKQKLNDQYFPKCCPIGQKYKKTFHSCEKTEGRDKFLNSISNSTFVKIGLPECDIISDMFYQSFENIKNDNKNILSDTGRVVSNGKFCLDETLEGDFVLRICESDADICNKVRCIHKCCPDGQSYVNGSKCVNTFNFGVNLHFSKKVENPDDPFVVVHGARKPFYFLDSYNFTINKKGILAIHMNESHKYFKVSDNQYCFEHLKMKTNNRYITLSPSSEPEIPMKFSITRWIKLISCIFLLLTISVYIIVPKMRNLFGKILLSYSVATFFMFFFLGISQFYHQSFNDATCRVMGFFSVLSMIWSFTWLHIMTIDIWFSFRAPRTTTGPLQKNEMKRLIQYSLCGWGLPIFWILFILFLSRVNGVAYAIRPIVGEDKCYMEDTDSRKGNYAYVLYVITPLLIQQIINLVLFIRTIMYCLRIKAEIEKMRDDVRAQKDLNASKKRLILIAKLAVIMGVSFLFETISSIIDFSTTKVTATIEIIWDSINCLQGVFIFIIFICKKKVYDNICEEIPFLKPRKFSSVSSTATQQISLQQYEEN